MMVGSWRGKERRREGDTAVEGKRKVALDSGKVGKSDRLTGLGAAELPFLSFQLSE